MKILKMLVWLCVILLWLPFMSIASAIAREHSWAAIPLANDVPSAGYDGQTIWMAPFLKGILFTLATNDPYANPIDP